MTQLLKAFGLSALVCLLLVCCVTPAFAQDATAQPPTDWAELAEHLAALGTLVAAGAAILSAIIPKNSRLARVAQILARWFPDFRGHRVPAPPEEKPPSGYDVNGLLVLMLSVLLLSGCVDQLEQAKSAADKIPPVLSQKDRICLLVEQYGPKGDPRVRDALETCKTSDDVNLILAKASGVKACAVVIAEAEAAGEL